MTPQSPIKDVPPLTGLTSDEARRQLDQFGPNTIPDTALHPLRRLSPNSGRRSMDAGSYGRARVGAREVR